MRMELLIDNTKTINCFEIVTPVGSDNYELEIFPINKYSYQRIAFVQNLWCQTAFLLKTILNRLIKWARKFMWFTTKLLFIKSGIRSFRGLGILLIYRNSKTQKATYYRMNGQFIERQKGHENPAPNIDIGAFKRTYFKSAIKLRFAKLKTSIAGQTLLVSAFIVRPKILLIN